MTSRGSWPRREIAPKLDTRPKSVPTRLFNLACYLALDGERERSLSLLRRAIRSDDSYRSLAREEEDLLSLREDPEFRRIVSRLP